MNISDFLSELNDEVQAVLDPGFMVEIIETRTVPTFDDPDITYDNLVTKVKRSKRLESCVLYVDIRDSASISAAKRPATLARMYSTFVRSMIRCARHFGGHVRNIIGDRVMVVFDQDDCFTAAVNTAILMNTVSEYIIDRHFTYASFRCGIGIDYGKMLITKGGAIRYGAETEFYRSLVWLGTPANVASRLTDMANKTTTKFEKGVSQGLHFPLTDKWIWQDATAEEFFDELQTTGSPTLTHKDPYFKTFIKATLGPIENSYPPILMTKEVFDGFVNANPTDASVTNKWWRKQSLKVDVYDDFIYGGDVYFTAAEDL